MSNDTPPLTVAEAAEISGIPKRTIQDAITRGAINAVKLPGLTGTYLLNRNEFTDWAALRMTEREQTA